MRKCLSVLVAIGLVMSLFSGVIVPVPTASAAVVVGCSYPYYYAPYDGTASTGTPLAYFVTLAGAAPSTSYYLNAYYYNGTNPSGAYLWNSSTASWLATTSSGATSSTGHPVAVTDASGDWSGWILMKSRTDKDYVVPPNLRIRFYLVTTPSTNYTATYYSVNMMNMGTWTPPAWATTQGGWISGTAYLADGTTPAQNKIVVVKNGTTIIGMYVTEDNSITDGYTATPGAFTVAAPVGTGYSVEMWNPATNTTMSRQTTSIAVTAGGTTTGVVIVGNSPPTLSWTGEAGYTADGVEPNAGDYPMTAVYRIKYADVDNDAPKAGYPVVHILKSGVEVAGSPFVMSEVDAGDTTYTDGKLYTYSKALKPPGSYSYSFEAKDVGGSSAAGAPTASSAGPIVAGDSTPPDAYGFTPQRYSTIYDKRPTISADFSDSESPIDTSSVTITVDAVNVTSLSTVTSTGVTYIPATDLALGTHTVAVSVSDTPGNVKSVSWYFSVIQSLTTPGHYLGDLHSHTGYSDGALTPADAYTYARDTANIDFLAVTDHSNSLNSTEWADTQTQADAFTENGSFVGLAGFEYTNSSEGHANVYNTSTYVSRSDANYDTLAEFYAWLKTQPDAIAEFNHPFTLQDFGSFSYDAAVDQKITMQEVGNGSPPYSYALLEDAYVYALDRGWHVAATNNQDNHGANWGYPPNNLTGIVASSLAKADILSAMRAMRTYGTEDRNLQLSFLANGYWMGSTIPSAEGDTITFHVELVDPDVTDKIVSVQIITLGGRVLASTTANSNSFSWDYSYLNPGGGNWYYLKAVEADGDIAISSPIWTPPADIDLRVTSLSSAPSVAFPNEPLTLTATVGNFGLFAYSSLNVTFYLGDPADGGTMVGSGAVSVAVGGSATTSTSWTPTAGGDFTLYAILTGPAGDPVVDNTAALTIKVIEANDHTVLIDRYHNNDYTSPSGLYNLTEFADLLKKNGYKVLENNALITGTTLLDVDLLVIPYPQGRTRDISVGEQSAIAAYVASGGALLFAGDSNYGTEDPTLYNGFLTSMGIGINLNHDNVYDFVNTYGSGTSSPWSVNIVNFPATPSGIGNGISRVRFYSGDTLITPSRTPLVSDPAQGIEVLAYANGTSWDEDNVATTPLTRVGAGYYIYSYRSAPAGSTMPTMAVQTLPNGSRVAVLGRSIFSNYEMGNWVNEQAACNNEAFSLNLVDWLCNYERVMSIAEAREDLNSDGIPDRLGQTVTVKGTVTAASGTFFDVTYLQDATGGITVFGAIPSDTILPLGAVLQVKGVVDSYNGDTELTFSNFADDFVWVGWTTELVPKTFGTGALGSNENEGWLVKTLGSVTQIIDGGTCVIDDGSGPIVVFIDGYVGALPAGLRVGDYISCIGLSGEYAFGRRIRVRNPSEVSIIYAADAFIVAVTAGEHGTVTPGSGGLAYHATQAYLVKPNPGYLIDTLTVDGVVIKEAAWKLGYTLTLTDIQSNHTISATFRPIPDMLAPTITLPDFSKMAGIVGWSGGAVPMFTVGASPFPLTFILEDNSGSAKWTITVNGITVIDPVGTGSITFPIPLAEGRNDVEVSASDAAGNYTSQRLIIYLDSIGPVLAIDPALPSSVTKPELTIAGSAVDGVSGLKSITINGTRVVPFLDGSFSETLVLAKGVNAIVIEAEDKVGHKASTTYSVTYATAVPPVLTAKTVTLTIGKAEMDVNGMPVALDAAPIIQNGRTLLPLRALIETLGGTVVWDGTTRQATVTLGSRTVAVTIGDPMGLAGGKKVAIDPANAKVVPVIINGRTMLPLRFIAENLGLDLAWDAATRTISFTYWP